MEKPSLLWSPAPYHVLSYGALLGSQFFHTFINAPVSFKTLERPQFAILQRGLFPAYFSMQAFAPFILAVTYPGSKKLLGEKLIPAGISGVLHGDNRSVVLVPLATMFVTGFVNLVYLLPETNRVTAKRRQQETKDGKRSWDAPPHSEEMVSLNKQFGKLHGISSLLNLVTFIATVVYGVSLSSNLE